MSYIGPALPPHMLKKADDEDAGEACESSKDDDLYGPALPAHLVARSRDDDDSDDDAYGPLPVDAAANSLAHRALEERALQIKLGYLDTGNADVKGREEWMMELPEVGASKLGLGPRQFRKNAGPDMSDRSSWTDTPEQKAKKSSKKQENPTDLKKEAELKEMCKRDAEQADMAKRHSRKKKRDKSLLEMHQDELKKKKLENADKGEPTRRPFNRDIDLKVNQFDDAQKKSVIKKAMLLDDRFSSGQSKFL